METRFNFTAKRIEELKAPKTGEAVFYDDVAPGLMVRIRASGAASFAVRYRIKGDRRGPQRLTIGDVNEVTIKEARDRAEEARAAARAGRDPAAERKASGAATAEAQKAKATLADLIDSFERDQKANGVLGAVDNAKSLRREFKAMLGRNPASIARDEIVDTFNKIRNGVPGHAAPRPGAFANVRARIHGLLAWAENDGRIPRNVMAGYRAKRRSKAGRLAAKAGGIMLDMDEIAALWGACDGSETRPSFAAYAKLLILTGCRRGELAQARLSWISPARGNRPALLTIPAEVTKNGRPHIVPLAALAAGVIAGVKRFADRDPLVTPGAASRKTGARAVPISGWSKSWPALLRAAEGHGLKRKPTIHDLRRTFRSHLARLGVPDRVAEAALNHAPTDRLVGIYDKHDYLTERIEAAEKWAAEISAALARPNPEPASAVPLHPAPKVPRSRRKLAAVAS
jgi:integrase